LPKRVCWKMKQYAAGPMEISIRPKMYSFDWNTFLQEQ